MILVDTSVWISYFRKDDPGLSEMLKKYLKDQDVYAVSAVFGELLQGVRNDREREIINLFWENLPKVDETRLFIEAGNLSSRYKFFSMGVGLMDCYILAAALQNNLALWTLDKKLQKAIDVIESVD